MNAFDPAALECLAALADAGSFERAAQALSITQSAVSQRLRALETDLGQRLVVRARPLRFTEQGKVLLRFARQMRAMQADLSRELGQTLMHDARLPIAVNADSLATWVLPALDPVVQSGLVDGWGVELIVDDQDFTHDWLREGAVLGCVSTVSEPLRGCRMTPLGCMRYIAVASPEFLAAHLGQGLHRGNVTQVPWLVFNRKDDMHAAWVQQAFGMRGVRLRERPVPSTEAHARAAVMGWGLGVVPEQMAAPWLGQGRLVQLHPEVHVDVVLHWHQWRLPGAEGAAWPSGRGSALDRIGAALADGARLTLKPAAPAAAPG